MNVEQGKSGRRDMDKYKVKEYGVVLEMMVELMDQEQNLTGREEEEGVRCAGVSTTDLGFSSGGNCRSNLNSENWRAIHSVEPPLEMKTIVSFSPFFLH